jgi:two-component system, OmpR family, KDP operon response regulator KdpE
MTRASHRLLIVEGDPQDRNALRGLLGGQGYRLREAATPERAVIEARSYRPDLLIVDLGVSSVSGLAVIRRVRTWSTVPILALASGNGGDHKIEVLDAGADDYIVKPFSEPELLARVRAALRRRWQCNDYTPVLKLGALRLDLARRRARGARGDVHLTPLEYRVLECLARNDGRVVSRRELLREAWGPNRDGDINSLRVCISNLRAKIEPNRRRPRYLTSVSGVGYRLCAALRGQEAGRKRGYERTEALG